jgi:translocation and assembly module TamA
MTDELFDRLAREAIDRRATPPPPKAIFRCRRRHGRSPHDAGGGDITVVPGEPARIASVRLTATGPATMDVPRGTDAIAKMKRDWSLPVGAVFRQPAWAAAKASALSTLTASPYPAARIEKSEALIDPAQHAADLTVEFTSGPEFRFGVIEISGLSRYAPSLVRNYSTFAAGEPYSEAALVRYIRRLNASGYFASVQAAIDPARHPKTRR